MPMTRRRRAKATTHPLLSRATIHWRLPTIAALPKVHRRRGMHRALPHTPAPLQQHQRCNAAEDQHGQDDEADDRPVVAGKAEANDHVGEAEANGGGTEDAVAEHEFGGLAGLAVDGVAGGADGEGEEDEDEDDEADDLVRGVESG
jgi:hypothetical protein